MGSRENWVGRERTGPWLPSADAQYEDTAVIDPLSMSCTAAGRGGREMRADYVP